MSATFVLFTGIEILIALILIIEIINKDMIMKIEDRIIKNIKRKIRRKLRKKESAVIPCKNKNCNNRCINRAA